MLIHNPIHLPVPALSDLIGRDAEIDQLRGLLNAFGSVWVHGTPGVGRRTLAASVTSDYITETGRVLWVVAYHDDIWTLCSRVVRAYEVTALSSHDLGGQLEMARALLDKNRPLVVFEGPIASGVVAQFLQHCAPSGLPVIINAPTPADGPWEQMALSPLSIRDAEQLYRQRGQLGEERRSALLAPLLNYVEGHPLALSVAAHQRLNAGVNSTHLASLLPEAPPGPQNRAVGVFAAAHSLLDSTAQGLFLLLGALFVDRVSLPLLSAITTAPESFLQPLLQMLTQRGLIDEIPLPDDASLYRIHDLARIYARRRLKGTKQLKATRQRIVVGIVRYLDQQTTTPSDDVFDLLAHDMDHVLGAARHAESGDDTDTLEMMFKSLGRHGTQNVIHARGYHALYSRLGRMMSGDPIETARVMLPTSSDSSQPDDEPSMMTSQPPSAMSREGIQAALDAARGRGDWITAARLMAILGDWYTKHRHFIEALPFYMQAAQHYQGMDDSENLAMVLHSLGETLLKVDQPAQALERLTQAMVLSSADRQRQGALLVLMGDAKLALEDQEGALAAYQDACQQLEAENDLIATGLALGKKATIYLDQGENESATVELAQSIALFERAGRRDLQGQALGNLGTAFGRMGRWREAGQRHMLALQIAREIEDVEEERYQLMNLAFVAESEGHYDWAIHYNRQALYLILIAGDDVSLAHVTLDLGRLLLADSSQLTQAVVLLEASVEFAPNDEAVHLLNSARKRLSRLRETGYVLPPAERNLQTYAQIAYEHHR